MNTVKPSNLCLAAKLFGFRGFQEKNGRQAQGSNAFLVFLTCLSWANSSPHHDSHDVRSQTALSHLFSSRPPRSISSLFTGKKGQRVFLGSCSVKCKLSLTRRGQAEGLTGEPSIQMMRGLEGSGGRGEGRESLSLHCVSITLKRKLIHSALNCMPRPSMCPPHTLHPVSSQCGRGNI